MSAKPIIYCTHTLHPKAAALLSGRCELRVASALDLGTLGREGRHADVLIVRANMPPAVFADAPKLRAAVRHGAGLDMIPLEAATGAGMLVANVPGVNARSVAEHIMFVSLALSRRFRRLDMDLRNKGWEAGRAHAYLACELHGRTLGLIGMGSIGRAATEIARNGFGMKVLAHTPRRREFPSGVEAVDLEAIFARSDTVAIACPLTPETHGLANAARLALMKPSAVIVNVARGAIIDDDALLTALQQERIAGAALDVFPQQPLRPDHPYFSFDNVILTPHVAGITNDSMERMGIGSAEETIRILNNELPLNFINPEVTEAYRKRFPAG